MPACLTSIFLPKIGFFLEDATHDKQREDQPEEYHAPGHIALGFLSQYIYLKQRGKQLFALWTFFIH
jgi:hypothetical protein